MVFFSAFAFYSPFIQALIQSPIFANISKIFLATVQKILFFVLLYVVVRLTLKNNFTLLSCSDFILMSREIASYS